MRFVDGGSASVSCFCVSVGSHWSRNLPVCVSGSGSLVWVSGHSSDLDHRQFFMTVLYAGLLALVFSMVSRTLRVFDTSFPRSPPFLSPLVGMVGLFSFYFSAPSCLASPSPMH